MLNIPHVACYSIFLRWDMQSIYPCMVKRKTIWCGESHRISNSSPHCTTRQAVTRSPGVQERLPVTIRKNPRPSSTHTHQDRDMRRCLFLPNTIYTFYYSHIGSTTYQMSLTFSSHPQHTDITASNTSLLASSADT